MEKRKAGRRDGAKITGGEGKDDRVSVEDFFPLLTAFLTQDFSFLS